EGPGDGGPCTSRIVKYQNEKSCDYSVCTDWRACRSRSFRAPNCRMSASESLTHTREPASVRFTGANVAFRRLVEYGALFELLTFGFYRFWLATDIRRFLWSNTEID